MSKRFFPLALLGLALAYPAFLAALARSPEAALRAAWFVEAWAFRLPWVIVPLFWFLQFAFPAFGERARDAFRAARAQLTMDRREIPELLQGESRLQNHYYAQKLGEAYFRRFLFQEAEEAFRRAAPRDPASPSTFYLWGRSLLALRRPADAATVLRHARDLDPAHDLGQVTLALAEALLGSGEIDEGIARGREFLQAQGAHPRGHYVLALLLEKAGDREGGRQEMGKMLELFRSAPDYSRREDKFMARRARAWLNRRGGPAAPLGPSAPD